MLAPGATRRERLHATFAELHARKALLTTQLWTGLAQIANVKLYGPAPDEPRTPTVAFTVRGVAATEVARQLATHGLFASHGDFYAATVIERLGLAPEGLVRAGCACYTTTDEIERLLAAVRALAHGSSAD